MGQRDDETTAIPDPPWWSPPNRGKARTTLNRDLIVDAAIRVLNAEGLDGLSMRRVAQELGTGAATLYWHITGKDQLIDLILDRVMAEIELPEPDPGRWREQVAEFAHQGRAVFGRYRDLGRATLGRVPLGPNMMRITEWLLALLRGAGIPVRPAAWFGDIASLFLGAQALEDDLAASDEALEVGAQMGAYLAAMPPDLFPTIREVGAELTEGGADDRFQFAVDLMIRGLASYAEEAGGR